VEVLVEHCHCGMFRMILRKCLAMFQVIDEREVTKAGKFVGHRKAITGVQVLLSI